MSYVDFQIYQLCAAAILNFGKTPIGFMGTFLWAIYQVFWVTVQKFSFDTQILPLELILANISRLLFLYDKIQPCTFNNIVIFIHHVHCIQSNVSGRWVWSISTLNVFLSSHIFRIRSWEPIYITTKKRCKLLRCNNSGGMFFVTLISFWQISSQISRCSLRCIPIVPDDL